MYIMYVTRCNELLSVNRDGFLLIKYIFPDFLVLIHGDVSIFYLSSFGTKAKLLTFFRAITNHAMPRLFLQRQFHQLAMLMNSCCLRSRHLTLMNCCYHANTLSMHTIFASFVFLICAWICFLVYCLCENDSSAHNGTINCVGNRTV